MLVLPFPLNKLVEKYKSDILSGDVSREIYRSSDMFIIASIVGFVTGAFQIAGAVLMWASQEHMGLPCDMSASMNIDLPVVPVPAPTPSMENSSEVVV